MKPLILSLDLSVSNMDKIGRDNFFAPIGISCQSTQNTLVG